jgi:hypothetical protein
MTGTFGWYARGFSRVAQHGVSFGLGSSELNPETDEEYALGKWWFQRKQIKVIKRQIRFHGFPEILGRHIKIPKFRRVHCEVRKF